MGEILKKDDVLHIRGADGKLLPQKVQLETLNVDDKPFVEIIPMTRGELIELYKKVKDKGETDKDDDIMIIQNHLTNPVFSKEELSFAKPQFLGAIVLAIMSLSTGVSQQDIGKNKAEAIEQSAFLQSGK